MVVKPAWSAWSELLQNMLPIFMFSFEQSSCFPSSDYCGIEKGTMCMYGLSHLSQQ